jgi:hypothetical protein
VGIKVGTQEGIADGMLVGIFVGILDGQIVEKERHTYKYEEKPLVSVTTILKPYFPFNAEAVAADLSESSNPKYSGKTVGEIISQDNSSLTIKLRDGGSKIVFFSADTKISKMDAGSLADLKIGESVMANGTANADGSVTAATIQLTPAFVGQGNSGSSTPFQVTPKK